MKMIVGLFIGVIVGGLLLVGPLSPVLAKAASGELDLRELLPDIGNIYREAYVSPFQEAVQEIEDKEIAGFMNRLLKRTNLSKE